MSRSGQPNLRAQVAQGLGDRSWTENALCAQTDPEIFFPEKGQSNVEGKRVCRKCTVRKECLMDALERDERWGIWGGLSERERQLLKAQRPAA